MHSDRLTASDPAFRRAVARAAALLRADGRVASVQLPQRGASISADGHTALVTAGAKGNPTAMVAAADELKSKLAAAGGAGVSVSLTGASGMWSDFNTANRTAMMKSELISWPVTLAILVLAFGSLVAAGLPLMLTILGLVASAGLLCAAVAGVRRLDLGDELRADVRARARDRLRALRRPPLPRRALRLEARRRARPSR